MVEVQLRRRGIGDERVLEAMARVPRHEFIAPEYWNQAYDDHPIPIGEGQTISQPYIVAVSLAAATLRPSDLVLEIGTGSGYQTAILAELVTEVYSIERLASLASAAESKLARLGYTNVQVVTGDGTLGLRQASPFDAIIVSAAAPELPPTLLDQLKEGGRIVIPIGPAAVQQLQLVQKERGTPHVVTLDPCRFVPLIGG